MLGIEVGRNDDFPFAERSNRVPNNNGLGEGIITRIFLIASFTKDKSECIYISRFVCYSDFGWQKPPLLRIGEQEREALMTHSIREVPIKGIMMSLEVLVVDISHGVSPEIEECLNHTSPPSPRGHGERTHHVEAVQQCARSPELPVIGPALLDPVDVRRGLPHHVDEQTWEGRRLAREQAGLEKGSCAAADGEECTALAVHLTNEGNLGLGKLVV